MQIPMIDGVPFGNTNPVANCAKFFASQLGLTEFEAVGIAFHYADAYIHGPRDTASEIAAVERIAKISIGNRIGFLSHLVEITKRVGVK